MQKQRRNTSFKKEWEIEFPWVREVTDDKSMAKCIVCNKSFHINSSGKTQVSSHGKTKIHTDSSKADNPIMKFLSNSSKSGIKVFSAKDDVMVAEMLWAIKCCMSNFSFSSNEGNNDLFARMFPDSKIAQNYRMSYTKWQYVVEFALMPYILDMLRDDFRNSPFTFKFDETTTVQVKKQYDGHLQYFSNKFQRVVNHYCGSLFVGHCTSEQLKDHFFEFGRNLKWNVDYLLHLGMDGPHVNKKFQRDLETELKSSNDKILLDVSTCSLHPIHNAFSEGIKKVVSCGYDKFASDLHSFFKRSAARREDFSLANLASDLEIEFMRRHVPSRWVSLKKAYERINDQWEHLTTYFLDFLPKQKNFATDLEKSDKYKNITAVLKSDDSLIYINFVICVAGILESYLIPMESTQPKIHLMYSKMGSLFFKLMSCFVKMTILVDDKGVRREACELGKVDVKKFLKTIHSVEFGTKAKYLIANLEAKQNIDSMKLKLRTCFVEITLYLQSHLPHQSIFVRDLECLQPEQRQSTKSPPSMRRIAVKIRQVLSNTKLTSLTTEAYADQILTEYKIYQSESFTLPQSEKDDTKISDEDYWHFIGSIKDAEGQLKFKNLVNLVQACFCISHGNASPERGFSENKHLLDGRESLGEETIVAIRLVKESVRLHGGVLQFPITRQLLNLFQIAKTAYEEKQQTKKAHELIQMNAKRIADEKTRSIDNLTGKLLTIEKEIADEESKIEAADTVLKDGQASLQSSLEKKI